ncbi:Pullulanase secretion protein pulG [uncultured Butyricicoccus sp.]|jgi:type IV pilus assembly protein PilA|nr:Pullulanase secretion protein pulG [uncultured Butyricicoccus sp.]
MMEKMIALQQKRRSKKGGFTLVELIVVLVILAILAALLIPALTGYIDKAKQKKIVAETRQCVMAAQTLFDEDYGTGTTTKSTTTWATAAGAKFTAANVADLAEIKDSTKIKSVKVDDGKVVALTYEDGKTCEYKDNQYTVK